MMRLRHYALIFILLAIISSNSLAETPVIIKFNHSSKVDSPKGLAAIHFKGLAEKMTKGKVRVDVFPDSRMYNDNDSLEALQLGAIQMLALSLSKLSTLGIHEFELFDLPYMFPNKEALYQVTQGPIGTKLLSKLEAKYLVGLGFWDNGFKSMFTNKPVHNPTDMRGLRMRIQPSVVLANQMQTLGAIPFALTYQDMMNMLLKRVIDGTETTPSNFDIPDFAGVPKHLTMTNHGYLGYVVVVNKKFWRELPPEIRFQLTEAMTQTTKYANHVAQQQNESDLTAMKESGKITVYELSQTEKTLWYNTLHPVQKSLEQRIGKELIEEVNQTIAASIKMKSSLPHSEGVAKGPGGQRAGSKNAIVQDLRRGQHNSKPAPSEHFKVPSSE